MHGLCDSVFAPLLRLTMDEDWGFWKFSLYKRRPFFSFCQCGFQNPFLLKKIAANKDICGDGWLYPCTHP